MPASSPVASDTKLERYGELAVRVALNLQPGQRLLIIGPLMNGGVSLEAAPLVRHIAASAYRAGAELVEAMWGDEALQLARFANAPRESFGQFSAWLPKALAEHAEAGNAVLSIYANDPDLLQHESTDLAGALQQATSRSMIPFRELISRNQTNWSVIATAGAAWAAKVFPDAPADQRLPQLRDAIERLCRLDRPDPVAAWQEHIGGARRAKRLPEPQAVYGAEILRSRDRPHRRPPRGAPLGERRVDKPQQHPVRRQPADRRSIHDAADRHRVSGTVRATKPLSYSGTLIEDFSLRFEDGRVVDVKAEPRRVGAAAARRHRRGGGAARRGRARAAQLANRPVGPSLLQHAVRRERRQPRRARDGLQIHAGRRATP